MSTLPSKWVSSAEAMSEGQEGEKMSATMPITVGDGEGDWEKRWSIFICRLATFVSDSALELVMRMELPRLARWRAVARPMPLVPPVMRETLPVRSRGRGGIVVDVVDVVGGAVEVVIVCESAGRRCS